MRLMRRLHRRAGLTVMNASVERGVGTPMRALIVPCRWYGMWFLKRLISVCVTKPLAAIPLSMTSATLGA